MWPGVSIDLITRSPNVFIDPSSTLIYSLGLRGSEFISLFPIPTGTWYLSYTSLKPSKWSECPWVIKIPTIRKFFDELSKSTGLSGVSMIIDSLVLLQVTKKELLENPHAALVFYWEPLKRWVRKKTIL